MEHIDNDMDDLFKKAGELYPLKISGSDWEGVAGKLQDPNYGDPGLLSVVPAGGRSGRRKWLLLLLLIPIAFAGIIYNSRSLKQKPTDSVKSTINPIPQGSNQKPGVTTTPAENFSGDKNSNLTVQDAATVKKDNSNTKTASEISAHPADGAVGQKNEKSSSENHSNGQKESNSGIAQENTNTAEPNMAEKTNTNDPENNKTEAVQNPETAIASVPATSKAVAAADKNKTATKDPTKEESKNSIPSEKKSAPKTISSKGFYAGIIVGPDLSTVKFQPVKQLGFSLGATVGYRINKQLAVETGFLWDRKYYHTRGEYFKNPNIPIAANADIDGNCNMMEIPVIIRYDFAAAKNHSFFAKAGLSSYLAMKDNYSWVKTVPQPPYYYPEDKSYNAPSNIFSILQLSAGYERAISSKINIQVEPYVKIPLQGVGTGNMPISSVGIYFGITHSFR
jgi:hypothetical protein